MTNKPHKPAATPRQRPPSTPGRQRHKPNAACNEPATAHIGETTPQKSLPDNLQPAEEQPQYSIAQPKNTITELNARTKFPWPEAAQERKANSQAPNTDLPDPADHAQCQIAANLKPTKNTPQKPAIAHGQLSEAT